MRVRVTAKHIREGKPNDAASCPIALALVDYGEEKPWVGPQFIAAFDDEISTPMPAIKFMNAFDAGKPVKPHTFVFPGLKRPRKEGGDRCQA